MPSDVSICNMGLYRVGSTIRITSLDESTERTEAVRQAGFWYPIVLDQVLASAPWGFARKSVALASVTDTTFPGYEFIYEYPQDCVRAAAVCDSGGMRNSTFWLSWCWNDTQWNVPKVPFQVGSRTDGNTNVIMTDIASAYLYYIFRQTITNTFTPLFVDALAWKIGAEMGQGVQASATRIDRANSMYEQTLSRALAHMLSEAQQDQERDSPSIQARSW